MPFRDPGRRRLDLSHGPRAGWVAANRRRQDQVIADDLLGLSPPPHRGAVQGEAHETTTLESLVALRAMESQGSPRGAPDLTFGEVTRLSSPNVWLQFDPASVSMARKARTSTIDHNFFRRDLVAGASITGNRG